MDEKLPKLKELVEKICKSNNYIWVCVTKQVKAEHNQMPKKCPHCGSSKVDFFGSIISDETDGLYDTVTYYCKDCRQLYSKKFKLPY